MNISKIVLIFVCLFLSCESGQRKIPEKKRILRIAVVPFQNKQNPKDNELGIAFNSAVISALKFSNSHRYIDEEFEKYYLYNAMQLAQSIGDIEFEKFLKDIVTIHGKENPKIDMYISGFYFQKANKTHVHIKILGVNGNNLEFQIVWTRNSIQLFRSLSLKLLETLEPENLKGVENLETGFQLTQNYEAYRFYLEGMEEKRKKTIYGYMNAIRKFRDSQRKDGLYLLPLNEIVHTIAQISTDLLGLTKHEKIINNRNINLDAKDQLKRNADILRNSFDIYTNAKKTRPEEYENIQRVYESSPYKKQYELKASVFKNQMEMLLLRWEDEKFQIESIVKGEIEGINSGYTPLLVTEFFQTLTDSKININDILRAILKYSKEHPENRYFIHYFKNFTRLIKTLNEFDYMKLNPEANFSYHQLHQEYIFYVREYLKVMKEGL